MAELYRYYDKYGELLYVGISVSTAARIAQHRTHAVWFKRVVAITIERFETRQEASIAEKETIIKEKPTFNVQYGTFSPAPHGVVYLNKAAEMLGMKPGELRTEIQYGRFNLPPLPSKDGRKFAWPRIGLEYYIEKRKKNAG